MHLDSGINLFSDIFQLWQHIQTGNQFKLFEAKPQISFLFLSVNGGRHDRVFSVGFRVPFGIRRVWEVKGRMAALALSDPLDHQVPGAGARLAPASSRGKK